VNLNFPPNAIVIQAGNLSSTDVSSASRQIVKSVARQLAEDDLIRKIRAGQNITREEAHVELATPETERSEGGKDITEALRRLWNDGQLKDVVDYRRGVLSLKD
jgi:hypothetical protein